MDIPKQMSEDRIGGQRLPRKEGSGFNRGFQARQPNAPASRRLRKMATSQKSDGKTKALRIGAPQPDCLIPAHAYLEGHDGAFSLRKYLCGAAGELFRPRRADARHLPKADQAEPAARGSSRPRSGPALQPGG